ncbi:hypothetical protein C6Y14_12290 [Streptomyces dioscori]|uniref:Uncharacterized protein n=1 Tax=Streptomyces dioscori TaxID=2109333 RepID=A0A2P8Q9N1_9ACTN|nr:hypothetical protein C6Y14_12290 [Streptomyces dioscori]
MDALAALGVGWRAISPRRLGVIPLRDGTSPSRAAVGLDDRDEGAVLLAGRAGEWTFVHDDRGVTRYVPGTDGSPGATALSAVGTEAVTSGVTDACGTYLFHAADGKVLFDSWEEIIPTQDADRLPVSLLAAVAVAGTVDADGLEPGAADLFINLRIVSALVGVFSLADIRDVPLWTAVLSPGGRGDG